MKNESIFRLIAIIAALHVVVLSVAFGLRHIGYVLAATLSATLIWGVVFFLNERQRHARIIGAIVAGLAVCTLWNGAEKERGGKHDPATVRVLGAVCDGFFLRCGRVGDAG